MSTSSGTIVIGFDGFKTNTTFICSKNESSHVLDIRIYSSLGQFAKKFGEGRNATAFVKYFGDGERSS